MHNGLDLHARGDKVFAMLHGIVHKVGYDKRSGIFVTLRHGDITVSYCHLSRLPFVKVIKLLQEPSLGLLEIQGAALGSICISPVS